MDTEIVRIHTDGACKENPGVGGFAAILEYKQKTKEVYGAVADTTNNRMELTAVIVALRALTRPCQINIYTDSQYVQKGMTIWLDSWKQKHWKKVKNVDLWQELDSLAKPHEISWHWVKGHAGNVLNERADSLANQAITEYLGKM